MNETQVCQVDTDCPMPLECLTSFATTWNISTLQQVVVNGKLAMIGCACELYSGDVGYNCLSSNTATAGYETATGVTIAVIGLLLGVFSFRDLIALWLRSAARCTDWATITLFELFFCGLLFGLSGILCSLVPFFPGTPSGTSRSSVLTNPSTYLADLGTVFAYMSTLSHSAWWIFVVTRAMRSDLKIRNVAVILTTFIVMIELAFLLATVIPIGMGSESSTAVFVRLPFVCITLVTYITVSVLFLRLLRRMRPIKEPLVSSPQETSSKSERGGRDTPNNNNNSAASPLPSTMNRGNSKDSAEIARRVENDIRYTSTAVVFLFLAILATAGAWALQDMNGAYGQPNPNTVLPTIVLSQIPYFFIEFLGGVVFWSVHHTVLSRIHRFGPVTWTSHPGGGQTNHHHHHRHPHNNNQQPQDHHIHEQPQVAVRPPSGPVEWIMKEDGRA